MNPVATSDAAFRGGACPTPEYTIAYTGNYTTSADANQQELGQPLQSLARKLAIFALQMRHEMVEDDVSGAMIRGRVHMD